MLAVGLILASCADSGRRFNPLSGLFSGHDVEPPPADGRPFPNLATVPRPPTAPTPDGYQAALQDLAGRRDEAILTDQALRAENPSRMIPPRPSTPLPPKAAASAPAAEPAERPQATGRPSALPSRRQTLFVGSVMAEPDGTLAEIQSKILKDAVEIATRTDGQIRLEGGTAPADRERVAQSLAHLGVPPEQIQSNPSEDSGGAQRRPAIEIFVDY
jgi:hypothetical protein